MLWQALCYVSFHALSYNFYNKPTRMQAHSI